VPTFFNNNSISILLNKYQKYLLDTILSLAFWVPIIGIWSHFVVKLDGWELLNVMIGTAIINASLGGLYGRILDKWRRVFNHL
jgi:hypothetical protein